MAFTRKQERFIEEYLIDLNGTQAAIRAGYKANSANEQAARMLAKDSVKEKVEQRLLELKEQTGINQQRVLREYAKLAFIDIRKFYNENGSLKAVSDFDDDCAGALSGLESDELYVGYGENRTKIGEAKKIKMFDKTKALDSLARHLGMFEKDNEQLKNQFNLNIEATLKKLTPTEVKQLLEIKAKASND